MKHWKRKVFPYVLLLPTLVLFGTYLFYPAINGFIYSFYKWNGVGPMTYLGLENYADLISDRQFTSTLLRTLFYTFVSLPLVFCMALALALVVSKKIPGVSFFRMTFYFPFMMSALVIGFSWRFLLAEDFGMISYLLTAAGWEPIRFLTNSNMAMATVIWITVWSSSGYYMMMFVAGLKNISSTYYEAARIDGATAPQCFRYITFPLLKPTSLLVLVLSSINILRSYPLIKAVTDGGPGTATKFLVQLIYETAFEKNKQGYASAMTIGLFVILALFTLLQFKLNKGGEQDAI
ncbi:MAG TPA: sugar ABC transporter permease [Candidatus Limiplasma stercoravium]|nr:sugar ABC transporter permease [Candidatus Limiplasma stercoravium]